MSALESTPGYARLLKRGQAAAAARPAVACSHCGLDVPLGLIREASEQQFCCHGCEVAWSAIHACGLERYYELQRADAQRAGPALGGRGRYSAFDDPVFAELYCTSPGPGLRGASLTVQGLHCAACVWLLERVPSVLRGLVSARVDYGRGQLHLVWRESDTALSEIASFIDRLGYPLHPLRERAAREQRTREERAAVIRIGIAAALFGNTMLIAFALYGGLSGGMDSGFERFFRVLSAVLATLSVFWPGRVFIRGALASARLRVFHMDVPIAVALVIGWVHGLVNTARGTGEVYFDTLTTLVFLLLIGRWIQQRQQRRAAESLELLFSLSPTVARRVQGDVVVETPVEALELRDVVEVVAGGSIPVDGRVIQGSSSVDIALLTGESRPVEVAPGDPVAAGSINLSSPLRIEVVATGRATRVGQLMALVEEHANQRAPIVRMADRLVGWFVPIVLGLAAITCWIWWRSDPSAAIEHAVALLIITCPCALGLATPLAVAAGVGRAAQRGILIKGGEVVEALAGRGVVVLDKTGTVTTGQMRLVRYQGPDHLKPVIVAAERRCQHPAAAALVEGLSTPGSQDACAIEVVNTVGGGVCARIDSADLVIGSARFVGERLGGGELPAWITGMISEHAAQGHSCVVAALDGEAVAVAVLGDEIRPDAPIAIRELRAMGWRPMLVSGDDPRIVSGVGESLGLAPDAAIGGASPEEKLDIVRRLRETSPVIMVGDGVNDAAALAAATVGVAVHGGAEASMAAADVYLSSGGLTPLVSLFDGARRTTAAIRRNLAVSLGYNVVFATLAMAGMINPLAAAVLMPISSATVVVLSMRTRAFEPGAGKGGAVCR